MPNSGNNVISYYLPLLIAQVGITDPNTQLLLNAIYAVTGWIAATAGARCHDIIGRRKMFLGSTAGMIICLAITAGGSAGYANFGSTPASDLGIAFIFGKNPVSQPLNFFSFYDADAGPAQYSESLLLSPTPVCNPSTRLKS